MAPHSINMTTKGRETISRQIGKQTCATKRIIRGQLADRQMVPEIVKKDKVTGLSLEFKTSKVSASVKIFSKGSESNGGKTQLPFIDGRQHIFKGWRSKATTDKC